MFFMRFPLTEAEINGKRILIEDFFVRIVPTESYRRLASRLVPYVVEDGQQIEDVAFQLYGDPGLHWVVFLCNQITQPYADWPMEYEVLLRHVYDSYLFELGVPTNNGFTVGQRIEATTGGKFEVVSNENGVLKLRSLVGVTYLATSDRLLNGQTPVPIFYVEDPANTIHHVIDVESGLQVDADPAALANGTQNPVSNLEHELNENEKKRNISVLDKKYLSDFIQSFERAVQ